MRSTALCVFLLGAGLAGAGGFGAACAEAGHTGLAFGSDGGGDGGTGSGTDSGGVGDDGGGGCSPTALGVGVFASSCKPGAPTVDWSPIRRISRVEYNNMVRDLLGDTTRPATGFSPESPMTDNGVNFQTNSHTTKPTVSPSLLLQYVTAAEALAQTAASSSATLSSILPCTTQDEPCAQQFISTFANRAFRGQLDATESASLLGVYQDVVSAGFAFNVGIQALITAILESPRFLYVLEFGTGTANANGVIPLSSYEVAARLALLFWRSVPDATLMSVAASGTLATGATGQAAAVQAQATRMLADPKAVAAIDDFTTQWIQLQGTAAQAKDTQFDNWKAYTGEEMLDETLTNVSQLVLAQDGGLNDLLTSPSSYVNQDLAAFYGVTMGTGPSVAVSDPVLTAAAASTMTSSVTSQFVSTALPNRAGILTNGSVMSTQAHSSLPSATLRGKLVREDVLCGELQGPPPGIPPAPTAPATDGGTTRSLFVAHATPQSSCYQLCHQFMDPIGFGFGFFDASGAWQATDANGFPGTFPPIDATGQVIPMSTGELSVSFTDATDLTTKLAASPQVQQCFTLQELRYALTRLETADDVCSLQQMYSAFTASNLNIQKLLLAVVGTDAFLYRQAEVPGNECITKGSSCSP